MKIELIQGTSDLPRNSMVEYVGEGFRKNLMGKTAPLKAYRLGKAEGMEVQDPQIHQKPEGKCTVESLRELEKALRTTTRRSQISLSLFPLGHGAREMVEGLTLAIFPRAEVMIQEIDTETGKSEYIPVNQSELLTERKDDWQFYCSGLDAAELQNMEPKVPSVIGVISRYEALLSRFGISWDGLKQREFVTGMAHFAGDVNLAHTLGFIEEEVEPYMHKRLVGFDKKFFNENSSVALRNLEMIINLYRVAGEKESVTKVRSLYDDLFKRGKQIYDAIKKKDGWVPI